MTESSTDARRPVQAGTFIPYALVIFFVGLGVRLLHLSQIRTAPFFDLLMGDAQSYHAWALQIASGDVIGSEVFYQAPLYPYFLGLVYAALGDAPMVVRLCQAVVGSLSCVLLALAGWRWFSKPVGIAAGVMLAVYAPAIFFDGLIQKSVLDVFLLCLMLVLLSRLVFEPRRRWAWLGIGLTLGGLMLTRENAVVFVGAILFWLLWCQRHLGTRRLVAAGFLVAGLAVVLLPVAIRNRVVSGEFHLTTAQFGPNFYIGNNENSLGTYEPLRFGHGDPKYEQQDATELAEQATGTQLTPGGVSLYWTGRALEYIWTQPGDWLQLMGRKLMLAWNAAEVADTEDQLSYADWSFPLRASGYVWHFGVLAPLAVLGMWATWPRRADLTLLYLLLGSYAVALVAFAVMARYRYPMVPFLVLFASAGVVNIGRLLQTRPRQRLVWAGAATVVFAVLALVANGAVRAIEAQVQAKEPHPLRQPNQLYRNLGIGRFDEVSRRAGAVFELSEVSRGTAFGDIDNDGDQDVLITNNSGRARLLINNVGHRNRWLGLRLVGGSTVPTLDPEPSRRVEGRDMLGARVGVFRDTGPPLWRRAHTDGSYASASDPRVLVGLGEATIVRRVRVIWPSGQVEDFADVTVDRWQTLTEGTGKGVGP